eukprot:267116-Amorphochlora_amoeboformis.AAC.1
MGTMWVGFPSPLTLRPHSLFMVSRFRLTFCLWSVGGRTEASRPRGVEASNARRRAARVAGKYRQFCGNPARYGGSAQILGRFLDRLGQREKKETGCREKEGVKPARGCHGHGWSGSLCHTFGHPRDISN